MIDYHKELLNTLETILPTHYEMVLTSNTATPCISYMELSNVDTDTGDTFGYSDITYQIKVWGNDIKVIQEYALKVDAALRKLGLKRVGGGGELYDRQSTMIQKVMSYRARAIENY